MPVLDAADWARRSIEALIAHTPGCYELIVIDNGSREPATQAFLSRVEGARIERNDANTGFGPASNQGVRLARGELVLFLNSDAVVGPGWLEPMLAAAGDRTVGAVSPMLLNEDGTLQQAGALVRRDGGTVLYGLGEDPALPEYGFPRTVDYAAGACLLVDRAAFEQAGGFDDVYAPAYFEDADLCLTMSRAGRRTVYEPRSRVVHALGASALGRGVDEIVGRNWKTFVGRWTVVCDARPAVIDADRPWSVVAARDAMASTRLLALGPDGPCRPRLGELARGRPDVRVTALSVDPASVALAGDGVEVLPIGGAAWPAWLASRRFHYDALLATRLGEEVRAALEAYQPQACLLPGSDGPLEALLEAAGLVAGADLRPVGPAPAQPG